MKNQASNSFNNNIDANLVTAIVSLQRDPLHLASSNHASIGLNTSLFNGSNFLGWTR